jgi:hypothetical protein
MHFRALTTIAIAAAALAAGGCGGITPPTSPEPGQHAVPAAQTANPAARAAAETPGAPDPETAARRFATTFIHWRFDTLAAVKQKLAAQAAGQLRSEMLDQARQAMRDASRRASNQANIGTIEAVAVRPGKPLLIVTHEKVTLDNAAAQAGYGVYLAGAKKTAAGWKLTFWRAVN